MNKLIFLESIKKMPLMALPVRSTYVSVKEGGILISPGSMLQLDQLKNLPLVTDIVAPNLFHCAGMMKASSFFSIAKKWGAPNSKMSKPDVEWTDELIKEKWPYTSELPMIHLQGMPSVNEVVFFHKESKSLIVTDLCFNMLDAKGIGSWLILNLFGTYKKFAISKLLLKQVKDKQAFENSLAEVFSYDFDNIILSHGYNIMGEAKSKLKKAFIERDIQVN